MTVGYSSSPMGTAADCRLVTTGRLDQSRNRAARTHRVKARANRCTRACGKFNSKSNFV